MYPKYNLYLFNIVLFLTHSFGFYSVFNNYNYANQDAEKVLYQFINYMQLYCNENYSFEIQTDILSDLSNNEQIKVTNDLPGLEGEETEINTYLTNLRKYSKTNPINIEYGKNPYLRKCYLNNTVFYGCKISKIIRSNKGTIETNEIIEIIETNEGFKIAGITSDIIKPHDAICEEDIKNSKNTECKLMELAERELKENKKELAISHFEMAKECMLIPSKEFYKFIENSNHDSLYLSGYKIGNELLNEDKYSEALYYYELIKKSNKFISKEFALELNEKISICKIEIQYENLLSNANYFYSLGNYDKALIEFEKSNKIHYKNETKYKIDYCNEKIKAKYNDIIDKEIVIAESLIRDSRYAEGFSILMKYRHSDRLSGYDYFLMAQIVNSPERKTKKEFNLNSKKCCVFAKQFMLNAYNRGYRSEGFEIFWNEHFTQRNRTCE